MTQDLGGRIWVTLQFYLRGEDAEKIRKIAKARGMTPTDDNIENLCEDLFYERLAEVSA